MGTTDVIIFLILFLAFLPLLATLIVRHAKQRRAERLSKEPYASRERDRDSIERLVWALRDKEREHNIGMLRDGLLDVIDRNRGNDVGTYGAQELLKLLSSEILPLENNAALLKKCGEPLARRAINANDGMRLHILYADFSQKSAAKKILAWYREEISFEELTATAEPELPTAA